LPKSVSANLKTHLGGTTLTLSKCLKIILNRDQPRVESVSKANPGAVTTRWDHQYETGMSVVFSNVRGMTELNGNTYLITVTGPRSFTLDSTDTTGFTTYTERGEARRVLGFITSHEQVTFENVVYKPTDAYNPSALEQASDLSVSNLTMIGVVASDEITEPDIEKGVYDNAEVHFFMINREALADGKMYFGPGVGNLGEVQVGRNMYEAEFRGLEHKLAQQAGSVYQRTCRADLGNDDHQINRCYVHLRPVVWSANLTRVVRAARDEGIGDVVRATGVSLAYHFKCTAVTAPGRSGPVEPTWPTTLAGTVVETPPLYPIIDVDDASLPQWFLIDGDHTAEFLLDDTFTISGSGGNDGTYTLTTNSTLTSAGDTEIIVDEAIPDSPSNETGSIRNDSRVTWEAIYARSKDVIISSVTSGKERYELKVPTKEPENFYRFGSVTFIDGENRGLRFEIKNDLFTDYPITGISSALDVFTIANDQTEFFATGDVFNVVGSTGNDDVAFTIVSVALNGGDTDIEVTSDDSSGLIPDSTEDGSISWAPKCIELFRDTLFDFAAGDEVELRAGCDKTLATCRDTFDNIYNMRAEPYVPGMDKVLTTPLIRTP